MKGTTITPALLKAGAFHYNKVVMRKWTYRCLSTLHKTESEFVGKNNEKRLSNAYTKGVARYCIRLS